MKSSIKIIVSLILTVTFILQPFNQVFASNKYPDYSLEAQSQSFNKTEQSIDQAPPDDCTSPNIVINNPDYTFSIEAKYCEGDLPGQGDLWIHNISTIAHIVKIYPTSNVDNLAPSTMLTWGPDYWFPLRSITLSPGDSILITASRFGNTFSEKIAAFNAHITLIGHLLLLNDTPDPDPYKAFEFYLELLSLIPGFDSGELLTYVLCTEAMESGNWLDIKDCFGEIATNDDILENLILQLTYFGVTDIAPTVLGDKIENIQKVIDIGIGFGLIIDYLFQLSDYHQESVVNVYYKTDLIDQPIPTCPYCTDNLQFVAHENFIPGSVVLLPGQDIVKTWRVKNIGSTTWGNGYQLVFFDGDQMGAPAAVNVPVTAPNQEVDLSINLTAPTTSGDYAGYWRMRNPQGTYFGEALFTQITVEPDALPVEGDITLTCIDCPSVLTPGQTYRPTIRATVNNGALLENRGDLLRNTDGNLFGAWPHVAVVGSVYAGQSYDFTFYADNPLTAPTAEGSYDSRWRVWRDGNWAGPEINIHFDVRINGGTRPAPPTLISPANWSQFPNGSTPALCVNPMSNVQYYFQVYESHDIPESGWTSSSCWTPPGLGPYSYQWHVKVRDTATGLESDWSETWHFTLYALELTMDPLEFSPGSPSASESVRVYTCVHGYGGIGLGLELYANTASDGSPNGDWMWIHTIGTFCYNHDDPNTWPNWETLPFSDGDHLIKAIAFGPDNQTLEQYAVYHLDRRRPNGATLVNPSSNIWLNTRTVNFDWNASWRVNNYRFVVGTNPDPTISALVDQMLDANTTSYDMTFVSAYPDLYWGVYSINELGTSSTIGHFGIDQVVPNSSITAFSPSVSYESAFPVTWGGTDDRSGVRWYDIQYRDGNREDSVWVDWMTNVTSISSIFIGQAGHTYYFRARALDVAGNLEEWPTGDGDTYITIDPSAMPPTPWWNTSYNNKRNILILNNDGNTLPAGYPTRVHFDAGTNPTSMELYAASQSAIKGDDVRIVYNNTTELSRFVQAFASDRIDIWFNLQANIAPNPGSDGTSYQIYYGNSQATNPPADVDNVFPPPVDTGTVGLWHFHDNGGSTFVDTSGYNHNGTLYNGSWATYGKFGSAGVFNGSSTYAEIPDASIFDLRTLTIEGWFKLYDRGTQLLLRRRMTTGTEEAYRIETRDWKFYGIIRGGPSVQSTTQLIPGRWYHLAFTYDGQTLRIYVNGQLEGSTSYSDGIPASMGPVILGRNSAYSDYMNGQIQGLRISNVAKATFPYGGYGRILNEPSTAIGDPISPPITGQPDLVVLDLNTYTNPDGGVLVQAVFQNQGDLDTQNGFYTDLYVEHLPTGTGDYTGSISFWVNDPVAAGSTVTLTTVITELPVAQVLSTTAGEEVCATLYAQIDSAGSVTEANDANNIFSEGAEVCLASPDAYEEDNYAAAASPVALSEVQQHNFDVPADQDWISFQAVAGESYQLRTLDLSTSADTYLYLYSSDGVTLLASNDDYAGTLASQISWEAPATGTYYVSVKQWNPNVAGCGTGYQLTITIAANNIVFIPIVVR